MTRQSGRRGRVYIAIASGAEASPIPFQVAWTLDASTDKTDVTSFDDGSKVYVAGLPDASGRFNGFWDDASQQTYTAATDGIPRKFYLYPTLAQVGTYWFATVLPDFSAEGSVDDAIKVTANWSAATPVFKVG